MLRTVTVKLKDRLLAEIEAEARARLERAAASGGSAWDGMRDLVIRSEAAPPDLAGSKAHLRGYGGSRRR